MKTQDGFYVTAVEQKLPKIKNKNLLNRTGGFETKFVNKFVMNNLPHADLNKVEEFYLNDLKENKAELSQSIDEIKAKELKLRQLEEEVAIVCF